MTNSILSTDTDGRIEELPFPAGQGRGSYTRWVLLR
jgi:hypothetical protein